MKQLFLIGFLIELSLLTGLPTAQSATSKSPEYVIRTKVGERITVFRIHPVAKKGFVIEYGQNISGVKSKAIDQDDFKFFTEKLSGMVEKRSSVSKCPRSWLSFEAKTGKTTDHFSLVCYSDRNDTRQRIERMANFLSRYVRL
ncbi:MAG: hypothetical protein KDD25_09210 [Bdellovibrionales bacterium]|nr:hypothetical protein [Bdellovibrionales bacterium]